MRSIPIHFASLAATAAFALGLPTHADTLVIRADRVHTMTGPVLSNAVVVIRDSKIDQVGTADEVKVPADTRTLTARVVTPGLIDAHSTVGLSGFLNIPADQDQLETSAPIQPELRAIDSYNGRDPLVEWVRRLGFTTLHTGHSTGTTISGQTMVVKTWPPNVEQAVLRPTAMIAATLGPGALSEKKDKPPGTSAKVVALLRAELIKAGEYQRNRQATDPDKQAARDLRLEALQSLLARERPLLVTAQRHQDILAAIRIASEFQLRLVLDGASDAPWVLDSIRAAGCPVIIHPTLSRPFREEENASLETAARLHQAGILFAFQSGFEGYVPKTRVALFEAAIAAANGLSPEAALSALTRDAARLLEIEDRVGSIAPGKDADLALFDGDPFEYTNHCVATVVGGVVTDSGAR